VLTHFIIFLPCVFFVCLFVLTVSLVPPPARHYGWALRQVMGTDPRLRHVILLEEDLVIAPDFFSYFELAARAIDRDECVFGNFNFFFLFCFVLLCFYLHPIQSTPRNLTLTPTYMQIPVVRECLERQWPVALCGRRRRGDLGDGRRVS
jgi:hypothetical protein